MAHLALPGAELVPVNYDEPPPDVRGRNVYILNFSYKAPVLQEMARPASHVVVLDHHATAKENLAGILTDLELLRHGSPGLYGKFDMDHSGAMLAWMYFFPQQPPPILVQYVEDRDLWRFQMPKSREVSAAIRSYPFDLALWDSLHDPYRVGMIKPGVIERFMSEGAAILRRGRAGRAICAHAHDMAFNDGVERYAIRVANTPVLQSEVAGKLAENRPFGACGTITGTSGVEPPQHEGVRHGRRIDRQTPGRRWAPAGVRLRGGILHGPTPAPSTRRRMTTRKSHHLSPCVSLARG